LDTKLGIEKKKVKGSKLSPCACYTYIESLVLSVSKMPLS